MRLVSSPAQPEWLLLHGATISLWHSLASCPQMAAMELPLQQLTPHLGVAVSARFLLPRLQNPKFPSSERKAWHAGRGTVRPSFLPCNFTVFYLPVFTELEMGPCTSCMLSKRCTSESRSQPFPYFLFQDRISHIHQGWSPSHSEAQANLTSASLLPQPPRAPGMADPHPQA